MQNNIVIRFSIFLLANYSALAIGSYLMQNGPNSSWYLQLNKAPWTPAGWVFGAAWFSIMLLFSFYMTKLSYHVEFLDRKLLILFTVQWILNVSWNFVFFNRQEILPALIVIVALWLLVGYFTFEYLSKLQFHTLLILPYLIWMTIATSLNAYIYLNN